MDGRKIFDSIPEEFDKWRPRYCAEAFADIAAYVPLGPGRSILELGPGTGQATEPLLRTGSDYLAIELGENFTRVMRDKYGDCPNFNIVNGDFETYDLGHERFDLVFSAAAIQWIDEKIAFSKSFDLLKRGGVLAMMLNRGDCRTPNEALYLEIQKVYDAYFTPEQPYTRKMVYKNAPNYGFADFEERNYNSFRTFSADDYASYIATHSDHISLRGANREKFFDGIRAAINRFGGTIRVNDTVVLYLARKN